MILQSLHAMHTMISACSVVMYDGMYVHASEYQARELNPANHGLTTVVPVSGSMAACMNVYVQSFKLDHDTLE